MSVLKALLNLIRINKMKLLVPPPFYYLMIFNELVGALSNLQIVIPILVPLALLTCPYLLKIIFK